MTTPDLEALAREHEEIAHLEIWDAIDCEWWGAIWEQAGGCIVAGRCFSRARSLAASAQARRQAAALIRAKAPGREEIAREFEKLLSPYGRAASLTEYDSGRRSAFGWARDAILALFHAPAEAGGGEDEGTVRTAGTKLLTALERYGFPVSDVASTAAMSVEARDLHNAARRFKIAITSTRRAADEPAVTNGQ